MTEQLIEPHSRVVKIKGQAMAAMPKDLYIPPEALEVILEAFEGPLDLLLYLIKRQNLDILHIPVAEITHQYMQYIELMQVLQIELAAEYLLMAAMLAEIKSRLLLPKPASAEEEEDDPRADLIRRLQEYERFKQAAQDIDALPRLERDHFLVKAETIVSNVQKPSPEVSMHELLVALRDVMLRADQFAHHHVIREPLSVRERMLMIIDRLKSTKFMKFSALFPVEEGRMGVVVSFMAILELLKQSIIEMVQAKPFGPIHIRAYDDGVGADLDITSTLD